jgi:NhaA family Na+:H+ antiporter
MESSGRKSWLDRPVDEARDHVLGPVDAQITLVEYGSYACPHCRAANDTIAEVRKRFGDRMRYVFRHRPISGSDIARRAADLAERADVSGRFWDAHIELMTRSETLTEDDLSAVAMEWDHTQVLKKMRSEPEHAPALQRTRPAPGPAA